MSPDEFANCLTSCGVFPGARILAAVSGGADSVCLLWLLSRVRESYPLEVFCAHAEHGLRGETSIGDMDYVLWLCEEWTIPFFAAHLDVRGTAEKQKTGTEETARKLRYAFLREIAKRQQCDFIALAHHRRDQAETVLLRAARGTDIRGLAAMQKKRGCLIRPLLDCDPEELRSLLRKNHISWREDATNADPHYARNRVRLNVLPELRKISPDADAALCRLASAAARDESYFRQQLETLGLSRPFRLADGAAFPVEKLKGLHAALVSRALSGLISCAGGEPDSKVLSEAMKMLQEGRTGSLNLQGDGHLVLEGKWAAAVFPNRDIMEMELAPGENETPFGRFRLEKSPQNLCGNGIDSQRIPWNTGMKLTVGTRRAGEKMIPFGHTHPQELRKLIAASVPEAALRRSVPVIRLEGNPVWLAGVRPAETCRQANDDSWILYFEDAFLWRI